MVTEKKNGILQIWDSKIQFCHYQVIFFFFTMTLRQMQRDSMKEQKESFSLDRHIYIHALRAEKCQNIWNSFLEQSFQHSPYSFHIKMRKETTRSIYNTKHNLSLMNSGIRLRNKRSSNQY